MDKEQKIGYQREVEEYLERNNIYNLFEDLTKDLIISQPADPIDFLVGRLGEPECKKIFVVGPPGSEVREISLQLSDYLGFNCVSVGDLLKKEVSKKTEFGQKIQQQMRQFRYVEDELVNEVVLKNVKQLEEEKKNVILEGYPKTRLQALRMQKEGIIPYSFVLLNLPAEGVQQGCQAKLASGDYSELPADYLPRLATAYQQEYALNIKHVKQAYQNNYYEVETQDNREDIIENIARLLKYRIRNKQPRRSHKIIVAGSPGSGRTTLAVALAEKYQLEYVSTRQLLMHQIQQGTPLGKGIQAQVAQGEPVNDEVLIGLVHQRIQQRDCKMKGFILDGFPKNMNQLYSLEDMRVQPSMVVILEGNEQTFLERVQDQPVHGVPQPSRSAQALQNKLANWREMLKQFEERYAQLDFNPIFKVNATASKLNVVEKVSFHLENSC